MESRQSWMRQDENRGIDRDDETNDNKLFVNSGMLRVQPSDQLGVLEQETLANMERDGLRDTQFVKSNTEDRLRARERGWSDKLLEFEIPDEPSYKTYEAVLDSTAGFLRCSKSCSHYQKLAANKGVQFCFGPQKGAFDSLIKVNSRIEPTKTKVTGLKTKDGSVHSADVVVIAGGFFESKQATINKLTFLHMQRDRFQHRYFQI